MATAIQAFTDREYPDVGGEILTIVPDLPSPQDGITWEDVSKHCVPDRRGGLVQGNCLYDTLSVFDFFRDSSSYPCTNGDCDRSQDG